MKGNQIRERKEIKERELKLVILLRSLHSGRLYLQVTM